VNYFRVNPTTASISSLPHLHKSSGTLTVYAFSFYPKRLTNEDITLQLTSKLTISYVEGDHQSDSVRGDSVETDCRHRGKYRTGDAL